jgi:hypothetical protein
MKLKNDGIREESGHNFPEGDEWEAVLERAWRPAWSIRSRKGCLAPIVTWWRKRFARDQEI